jgi:flagellar hook-associated protein 2
MGRLQTSIGLITGTDIVGTVNQLIAISARPRDRLVARTEDLQKQQTALAELTALVIGVQFAGDKLKPTTQYQARTANSSDTAAISATASANAPVGNIRNRAVQIAATHTAQSRGLTSDATTALGFTGEIVIRSGGETKSSVALSELNQGLGVQRGSIRITDRSGNSAEIDLSKAVTIDDVINTINNNSEVQVKAMTVGDSIKLTDNSGSTTGNLRVDEVGSGETAADLGLRNINVASSSATGTDIYGAITDTVPTGLQGVPLAKLGGGNGLGTLTSIDITTTDGTTQAIDISSAITTQDVVRLINDSGLDVEAKLNETASGFRIRDLSGGNANAFSITSSDSTASKLGIAQTSTSRVIEGSDLQREIITNDTKLSELRQGRGISAGTIVLRNANDQLFGVDVTDSDEIDIGELIRRINVTGISVTASINSTGDGISIVDNSGGAKKLTITDANGGSTAADLGFKVESTVSTVNGARVSTIDSRQADVIKVTATDSLDDVVERINESGNFGTATVVSAQDGTKSIAFQSARGGDVGRISVSSTGFDLGVRTTAVGKDAILEVELENGSKQQLNSLDGVFKDVVAGVSITAKAVTDSFVSVNVERDTTTATTNLKAFVAQYNRLVEKLDELTFFSVDSNSVGLLFGSSEALRIETSYSRLLSGSIAGAGSIRSVGEVGLSFTDAGKLELDETKLSAKLASSPEAVADFFTKESTGLLARLSSVGDRIAGPVNSLLISRTEALGERVVRTTRQTDAMQRRLDKERERLLAQFQSAELAISKLQSNQNAISQIQFISRTGER